MSTHAVKKNKKKYYYYLLSAFRFIFIIYAANESYSMTTIFAFSYIEKYSTFEVSDIVTAFGLFCVSNKYCHCPGKVTTSWLLFSSSFFSLLKMCSNIFKTTKMKGSIPPNFSHSGCPSVSSCCSHWCPMVQNKADRFSVSSVQNVLEIQPVFICYHTSYW